MQLDAAGDSESLGKMRAKTTQKEFLRDAMGSNGACNFFQQRDPTTVI